MDLSTRKDFISHSTIPSISPPSNDPEPDDEAIASGKQTDLRSSGVVRQHHQDAAAEETIGLHRLKAGAPIAQVLNNDIPSIHSAQTAVPGFVSTAPPFSGRLADLLLDPLEPLSGRADRDSQHTHVESIVAGSSVITLPKLPQLPVKTVKRARIPPLLQGLHQPPPLPTGRLFPPITSDQSSFSEASGERRAFELQHVAPSFQGGSDRARQTFDSVTTSDQAQQVNAQLETRTTDEEKAAGSTDNPERAPVSPKSRGVTAKSAAVKSSRKRKRWSDEETKNLLLGVSRFGIGNWKKILQCPDFEFEGRTAVDLKDRFRVCRPGDGLKQRAPKGKEPQAEASATESVATRDSVQNPDIAHGSLAASVKATPLKKPTEESTPKSSMNDSSLAEMGIAAPFVRHARRPRREFTEQDDKNLLEGFEKHGASWHSMRDDVELGFKSRHPTDLRDRFRIRYPTKYAKAGYKLKKKSKGDSSNTSTAGFESVRLAAMSLGEDQNRSTASMTTNSLNRAVANIPAVKHTRPQVHSKNHDGVSFLLRPLPTSTDADEVVYDYSFGDESPPTLDRAILQWADTSTSTSILSHSAMATTQPSDILHGDMSWSMFTPADLFHLNSATTLPLYTNDTSPTPKDRYAHSKPTSDRSTFTITSPTKRMSTTATTNNSNNKKAMPQTPNLPNIVFPHVPAASARNTVHNLPGPAHLLSVDLERPLPPSLGSTLDDAFGFVNSA